MITSFLFFAAMVALALFVAWRSVRRPPTGPLGSYFHAQALTLGAAALLFLVVALVLAVT